MCKAVTASLLLFFSFRPLPSASSSFLFIPPVEWGQQRRQEMPCQYKPRRVVCCRSNKRPISLSSPVRSGSRQHDAVHTFKMPRSHAAHTSTMPSMFITKVWGEGCPRPALRMRKSLSTEVTPPRRFPAFRTAHR